MKKILIILSLILIVGCSNNKVTNYSDYSFTDKSWEREVDGDIETIYFDSNGEFHYSCSCGNPVNDADLCETYKYNDKTKKITLNCIEETDETIKEITIIDANNKYIELDFDGEIRKFDIGE